MLCEWGELCVLCAWRLSPQLEFIVSTKHSILCSAGLTVVRILLLYLKVGKQKNLKKQRKKRLMNRCAFLNS